MRDKLALKDYLLHMHQAIKKIQRYVAEVDQVLFLSNEEKQDSVIRNLEVIGEAAANIQRHFPEFAQQNSNFPLKAAYATRNVLAHGYFKVDLELVWNTVERDLPKLGEQVEDFLQNMDFR